MVKTTFFTINLLKSWSVKFHTVRKWRKIGAYIFIEDNVIKDQQFLNINLSLSTI